MMITGATYPNGSQRISQEVGSSSYRHPASFLYNLSLLKDKVHQVQSLATIFLSPDHGHFSESTAIAIPTIGTLIQEIIVTASSMKFSCQQMVLGSQPKANNNIVQLGHHDTFDHWYGDNYNYCNSTDDKNIDSNIQNTITVGISDITTEGCAKELSKRTKNREKTEVFASNSTYDIVELDAADLLAKYTHHCQVCGKGFKRDANLRMHMRAHGDEYKSSAALSNPTKNNDKTRGENTINLPHETQRRYSCPEQGCRWNKKHAKFQPLKSMICIKNHYKRSHCPKMYVCNRCNTKQFSVLSDLRTHEKHCGDLKWQCSCGTTFSRKDKLMGHVALFLGHTPVISSLNKIMKNGAQSALQIQLHDL